MARQLRVEFENAFYHITSRGNLRDKIFYDASDRERFLKILSRTKERYGFLLHAYALMDNHYHLLMETPKANLSQIMQNINTSYTVYVNRKYQRSGHLLQGRFKGIIVDKDRYLVALSRYIHLNPVRVKLVKRPIEYPWTSYRAFMDQKAENSLVDTGETLSYFSKRRNRAVRAYREFVEVDEGRDENPFAAMEAGLLLGDGGFKAKVLRRIERMKVDEEIPQAKRLRKRVSIDAVIKACQVFYGKNRKALLERTKGNEGRQVAIYLAKILSGGKGKEIGQRFGIKGPAVSDAIKRIEGRLDKESQLRERIEFLKGRIIPEF
ncbi:MAG: transposase [Thermodesulfobacteriota bacterium]